MAAIAMLVLALIAAVAVFFVLRNDDKDNDAEREEFAIREYETTRR